jgi:biopolymer transport protein TolR
VDLPQAEANMVDYAEQLPTVITIDKRGNYYINSLHDVSSADLEDGEKVSINIVIGRVIARLDTYPQMKVFVRGDKDVNYGSVVQLMALLQQNGVDKVGIITETPE